MRSKKSFCDRCFSLLAAVSLTAALHVRAEGEGWYQTVWCEGKGGEVEVVLEDKRRVDCMTKTHAIEMDFAHKWPEAIGQSLDYAMLTGKMAGIVLILRKESDLTYWNKMQQVIRYYDLPVTAWKLGP